MTEKKIKDFTAATTVNDTDVMILEDATKTQYSTMSLIFNYIKTKLGLKTVATSGLASDLTESETKRFVTDAEKTKWNGYEGAITATNGDLSSTKNDLVYHGYLINEYSGNQKPNPLDINLDNGIYGLYSHFPGTVNLPQGFGVGFFSFTRYNTDWIKVIAHDISSNIKWENTYFPTGGAHAWTGWITNDRVLYLASHAESLNDIGRNCTVDANVEGEDGTITTNIHISGSFATQMFISWGGTLKVRTKQSGAWGSWQTK